jgi:nicotinamidase-related amidase
MPHLPRPALIILDVMSRFDFPGGDALAEHAGTIVEPLRALRMRFSHADRPVIYVNDNMKRWDLTFDDFVELAEGGGDVSRALARGLRPGTRDFKLLKPRHSAFFETPLPSLLADLGVNQLVITGLAGDSCVLCTALDAHVRSFTSVVPRNAVASQSLSRNERALSHLRETCGIDTPAAAEVLTH